MKKKLSKIGFPERAEIGAESGAEIVEKAWRNRGYRPIGEQEKLRNSCRFMVDNLLK